MVINCSIAVGLVRTADCRDKNSNKFEYVLSWLFFSLLKFPVLHFIYHLLYSHYKKMNWIVRSLVLYSRGELEFPQDGFCQHSKSFCCKNKTENKLIMLLLMRWVIYWKYRIYRGERIQYLNTKWKPLYLTLN